MLTEITAIGSLRLLAPLSDGPALRAAIDRQLQGADLAPSRLPPSAILIVRRIADPLPGVLCAAADRLRPPDAWARAAHDRLDELAALAERPHGGFLRPQAEAVLFADEAELVACLALDLVRGTAGRVWWWRRIRVLLPELTVPAVGESERLDPAVLLVAKARDVPAVFARLAAWQATTEVATMLDGRRVREVAAALAAAHDVDRGVVAVDGWDENGSAAAVAGESWRVVADRSAHTRRRAALAMAATRSAPPLEPWAPFLPADVRPRRLRPDQRCLLGVALTLHRAPATARRASFAAQARAWWRWHTEVAPLRPGRDSDAVGATQPTGRDRARRRRSAVSEVAAVDRSAETEPEPESRSSAAETGDGGGSAAPRERSPAPPSEAALDRQDPPCPEDRKSTGGPLSPRAEHGLERARADRPSLDPPKADSFVDPEHTTDGFMAGTVPIVRFTGEQVVTGLGGVLYLIHVLEELGIPAVFADDWPVVTDVGPWGALGLVARSLLADDLDEFARDPMWQVLAVLAGEDTGRVAAPLAAVADPVNEPATVRPRRVGWSATIPAFRAPAKWRRLLADEPFRSCWTVARDRLWLWSEAGYLVGSVATDGSRPGEQARRELELWTKGEPVELRRGRFGQVPLAPPPILFAARRLDAWTAAVTPAVRRRLELALEPGDHRGLRRLLAVDASIYLTTSHVDLIAELHQIWLPARRAGLDRDPGWLRDYGRVVLFHFR